MFRSDPRDNGVQVLLSVEEDSYEGELVQSRADEVDEDKSTGNYPGHGTPHPIGTSGST